jgi:hypothetical protein
LGPRYCGQSAAKTLDIDNRTITDRDFTLNFIDFPLSTDMAEFSFNYKTLNKDRVSIIYQNNRRMFAENSPFCK